MDLSPAKAYQAKMRSQRHLVKRLVAFMIGLAGVVALAQSEVPPEVPSHPEKRSSRPISSDEAGPNPTPASEHLRAAEAFVERASFAQAADAFAKALAVLSADDPARPEIQWRQLDAAVRAVGPDEDHRSETLAQHRENLIALAEELSAGPERPPELWAHVQVTLARSHSQMSDLNEAQSCFTRALDWWASAPASEAAVEGYLATLEEAVPLPAAPSLFDDFMWPRTNRLSAYRRYLAEGLEVLPDTVGERRARLLFALFQARVQTSPLERARARATLEAAVDAARGTTLEDTFTFELAKYLLEYGKTSWAENGELEFSPDLERALPLLEALAAQSDRVPGRRAASELERLRARELAFRPARAFVPGQPVQTAVHFRNAGKLSLVAAPVAWQDLKPRANARNAPFANPTGLATDDDALALADPLWEQTVDEISHPPYELHRETLELGDLPLGLYQVTARRTEGASLKQLLFVTHAVLQSRASASGLYLRLSDARTGVGLAGPARVWVGSGDGEAWESRSIELPVDGIELPWETWGIEPLERWIAVATSEVGPVATAGGVPAVAEREQTRFYAFTDRPAYRPGQTVQWRVYGRIHDDGSWHLPQADESLRYRVFDPSGNELAQGNLDWSEDGSASGEIALPDDTGLGFARIQFLRINGDKAGRPEYLGGATFFRIEDYRRPEFEATVAAVAPGDPSSGYRPGDTIPITVAANYYAGGPLVEAPVELTVELWANHHVRFDDPFATEDSFKPQSERTAERLQGRTDIHGVAHFDLEAPYGIEGDYRFNLSASIRAPSGQVVTAAGEVMVSEQAYLVEVEPLLRLVPQGSSVGVSYHTRRVDGTPVTATGEAILFASEFEMVSPTRREEIRTEVIRQAVTTGTDGRARVTFGLPNAGRYVLAWRGFDGDGRPILAESIVWATGDGLSDPSADTLRVLTPKDRFEAGETLSILVTAPAPVEEAILTIMSSRVWETQILPIVNGVGTTKIIVPKEWAPGVVLRVDTVGDYESSHAITEIEIPASDFKLEVKVTPRETEIAPGSALPLSLEVTHAGEATAGEATIAVYDAALEQIQEPLAGDPFACFYGQVPQGRFFTSSSLDLAPFSEPEDSHFLALTAGVSLEKLAFSEAKGSRMRPTPSTEIVVRHDLQETAFWEPALRLDAMGKVEVTVPLPDDTTRWVVRVWAADGPDRFGEGRAEFVTRLPLLARLNVPRFLVEDDHVSATATLQNQTDAPLTAQTSAAATGAVTLEQTGDASAVIAPDAVARFVLPLATKGTGEASLTFAATGEGVGDALLRRFPVVPHGLSVTETFSARADLGTAEAEWVLPEFDRESFSASLRLAPSPAVALIDALPYLARQPEILTEQVASRFVPLAIVASTLTHLDLASADATELLQGVLPEEEAADSRPRLSEYLKKSLRVLQEHQNSDGGWGWWCGGHSNGAITAYVTWGLTLAAEAGVEVPPTLLERARQFLHGRVEGTSDPDLQAWMLFALAARFSESETADPTEAESRLVAALWQQREALTDYARALLTVVTYRQGFVEEARILAENLVGNANRSAALQAARTNADERMLEEGGMSAPRTAYWGRTRAWNRWAQSAVEATAFSLMALDLVMPDSPLAEGAVEWLLLNRQGVRWGHTRATAIATIALAQHLRRIDRAPFPWRVQARLNGRVLGEISAANWADALRLPSLPLPTELVRRDGNILTVQRLQGDGPVFVNALAEFFNRERPITASGQFVSVDRQYHRLEPRVTLLRGSPLAPVPLANGEPIPAGTLVESHLTLRLKQATSFLIIEDLKPAGFEPIVQRQGAIVPVVEFDSDVASGEPGLAYYGYAEWRDEGLRLYIDYLPAGEWQIVSRWRAEHSGRFTALPAKAQAAYAPPISGHSAEDKVVVEGSVH